jgi:hypothetical protein
MSASEAALFAQQLPCNTPSLLCLSYFFFLCTYWRGVGRDLICCDRATCFFVYCTSITQHLALVPGTREVRSCSGAGTRYGRRLEPCDVTSYARTTIEKCIGRLTERMTRRPCVLTYSPPLLYSKQPQFNNSPRYSLRTRMINRFISPRERIKTPDVVGHGSLTLRKRMQADPSPIGTRVPAKTSRLPGTVSPLFVTLHRTSIYRAGHMFTRPIVKNHCATLLPAAPLIDYSASVTLDRCPNPSSCFRLQIAISSMSRLYFSVVNQFRHTLSPLQELQPESPSFYGAKISTE